MKVLGMVAAFFLTLSACAKPPHATIPEPVTESFDVGIILLGDTGTGGSDQYKVAKGIENYCHRFLCSFALLLGDNFYDNGVKSPTDEQFRTKFEQPYGNLSFKFHPVIGNHDARGSKSAQTTYKSHRWDMPWTHYALSKGPIDLYAIDTTDLSRHQVRWLERKLKASKASWRLVFGHHPIKSYGVHGGDRQTERKIRPLLEKYGVEFYASGHDHDKQLIESDGRFFIVSGAGAKSRPTRKGAKSLFATPSLGFVHMLVNGSKIRLRYLNGDGELEFETDFVKASKT